MVLQTEEIKLYNSLIFIEKLSNVITKSGLLPKGYLVNAQSSQQITG